MDQLRAAQALLADRVAEVADGLVHEGCGTFEDAAIRWLNSKVAIRPTTRRSYQQLLSCYLVPYFGARTLRLIQVTDIERFRIETLRRHSRLDQTGVHRSPAESEAWSRRSPREATGKSGEDQHSLDQSAHSRLGIIQSRSESRRERVRLAAQLAIEDHKVAFEMAKLMGRGEVPPLSMYLVYHAELLKLVASGAEVTPLRRLMSLRYGSARKS